ncbi:MAG TPA: sulfurtransferase-like selenium metabolism protein YedF [Geobacteraceae bacterium]
MKIIDCRNMACPLPVVTVKRALEETPGEGVQVLLDEGAPVENVSRFALSRGFAVEERQEGEGSCLIIRPAPTEKDAVAAAKAGPTVLLVAADRIGDGPEELGRLLMKNFLITLLDVAELPDRILFLNTGVFLTTEGSEVLEALEALGNRGVEVLSCGACLDYFHRKEKLAAGTVTNMFTIAESLLQAGSVVRL